MNYNWHWKVLLEMEPGGTGSYLHYLFVGLAWTLATALAAWVIALTVGAVVGTLRTTPLKWVVRAGNLYVDPVLAAALATRRGTERKALSERERQVLRLLAEGGSYAEIGSTLFLSPDTVRAHAQRAMLKLGARTRTQAVAVALRESMIG